MLVEGQTPMVPGKDRDTKRRWTQDQSYTQMPRRPLSRTWGNSKHYRTGLLTILLARDARNNQTICQELRHVSTEQSGPTCTIWKAPIKRGPRPTMEINSYGFHHGLIKFRRIRHNTRRHRPPDKDEPFYSLQEGPRHTTICNTLLEGNHMITRHTRRHHYRQRKSVYIRIMKAHYGETWNRTTIKHSFPSTNRRADRTDELDTRTVSAGLYQLSARQQERAITIGEVRIQQWLS